MHKTPLDPYAHAVTLSHELLREIRGLDEFDLRRLTLFVKELVSSRVGITAGMAPQRSEATSRKESYRRQLVRCGKPACTSCPHGPYWYAYWREGGRVRSRYVGKELSQTQPG